MLDKLKALVKNSDVTVTIIKDEEVVYFLPYDKYPRYMTLEGTNDEERIASFIEQINSALDEMIDHLKDCKLRVDQTGKYTTQQVFCG